MTRPKSASRDGQPRSGSGMGANMRRRAASLGLMAATVVAGLYASEGNAQAQERVLKVAPSADLAVLDPMYSAVIITRLYSLMVYETLFSWDSKLQPQPQMVDRWSVAPDQLSWTFTLRPGLRFHDGSPVTTADVSAIAEAMDGAGRAGTEARHLCRQYRSCGFLELSDPPDETSSLSALGAGLRGRPDSGHHARRGPGGRSLAPCQHGHRKWALPVRSRRPRVRLPCGLPAQRAVSASRRTTGWPCRRQGGEGRPCRMACDAGCQHRCRRLANRRGRSGGSALAGPVADLAGQPGHNCSQDQPA
ncbi:hypothetical protein HMPREF9946_01911 [Acetobacteraceae bacterium AT-5844]|nr:hypothetical protein HMPREF9946_01911 [Acetobacteraceae bacterium AT-5844]